MKVNVKLKVFSFMLILLGILSISCINVNAAEVVSDFNGAKYKVTSVVEENLLYGGVKHTKYTAESSYTRNTEDKYIGKTIANQFYEQSVNTLEIPNNGDVKIVPENCDDCDLCIQNCPNQAISKLKKLPVIS